MSTYQEWQFTDGIAEADGTVFIPEVWEWDQSQTLVPDDQHPQFNSTIAIASLNLTVSQGLVENGTLDDGFIDLEIWNVLDDMPGKRIRVQISGFWDPQNPVQTAITSSEDNNVGDQLFFGEYPPVAVVPGERLFREMVINPNPDWEIIRVTMPPDSEIFQIVVDTISPEPGTMAMLAIGGLAMLRRRRR